MDKATKSWVWDNIVVLFSGAILAAGMTAVITDIMSDKPNVYLSIVMFFFTLGSVSWLFALRYSHKSKELMDEAAAELETYKKCKPYMAATVAVASVASSGMDSTSGAWRVYVSVMAALPLDIAVGRLIFTSVSVDKQVISGATISWAAPAQLGTPFARLSEHTATAILSFDYSPNPANVKRTALGAFVQIEIDRLRMEHNGGYIELGTPRTLTAITP